MVHVSERRGYLYARPEVQNLLKPLIVSWGYDSLTPGNSQFLDHNTWWDTCDPAAFLSIPDAIAFQEKYKWDKVRDDCYTLARETQRRI
jgi:isopenicillin-N epimerase